MDSMGTEGEDGSEGGVDKIRWTIGTVLANLDVCPGGESIKFRSPAADVDFTAAANARNSDCRCTRYCIAQDGYPVLGLDLAGGGCEGRIRDFPGACLTTTTKMAEAFIQATQASQSGGTGRLRDAEPPLAPRRGTGCSSPAAGRRSRRRTP
jgi:hypothetical protein